MTTDPFSSGDWLRIKVKFPGKCLKCKEQLEPGNFCFWSRSTKAIVHEGCYLPPITRNDQTISNGDGVGGLPVKESTSEKHIPLNGYRSKGTTKCFICSDPIDTNNNLISELNIISETDGKGYLSNYCANCLENFDDKKYELYIKAFLRKIKA